MLKNSVLQYALVKRLVIHRRVTTKLHWRAVYCNVKGNKKNNVTLLMNPCDQYQNTCTNTHHILYIKHGACITGALTLELKHTPNNTTTKIKHSHLFAHLLSWQK